jgi:hypothetical protein
MKSSAPKFCLTGSHATVQMKLRPNFWIAPDAWATTLYDSHTTRPTVASDAAAVSA